MTFSVLGRAAGLLLAAATIQPASAQYYKIGTRDEIIQSARTLAYDLMLLYHGNETGETPGILPGPPDDGKGDYYWWQGGAMMGTYIDYWKLTGDDSYNAVVQQGMLWQTGPDNNYMPPNFTASMGNDDQGFWGMSAMLAAENKFPDPPEDKPQWLALAQAVWTTQASPDRHDDTCGGGIRWQIPSVNAGYNYKNTIANGCFFNMGARLARYTQNETYAKSAEETWDWLWSVKYIDNESYDVYDGGHVEYNCTDVNPVQFSYNHAVLMQGAAFMYNYTNGSDVWGARVSNLLNSTIRDFFPNNTAYEIACESSQGGCTADMLSFKGYVHRWMAVVAQVAPFTKDTILPLLQQSTQAAVNQCVGGDTGRKCGFYWSSGQYVDVAVDHTTGAGEQMNVLAAVSSLLIEEVEPPTTNFTGGTSKGDYTAGTDTTSVTKEFKPITTGDKAGAGILTFVVLSSGLFLFGWMSWT